MSVVRQSRIDDLDPQAVLAAGMQIAEKKVWAQRS